MKNTKKALLMTLCAVMLVAASVMGTMAYLTSTTEVVKNTFTVGKVGITLDEAPVDINGKVVEGDRVTENAYKLMPGHSYTKDPTVHVDANSENAWLFVKVTNGITAIEDTKTVAAQMEELGWTPVKDQEGVYAYKSIVTKGQDVKVFESFKIKGDVTNETLATYENQTITVKAYAVQADGFATADAAWTAAPADWTK